MTRLPIGTSFPRTGRRAAVIALACLLSSTVLAAEPTPPIPAPPPEPAGEVPKVPVAPPDEHYDLRLRELEERVVSLKEKIFRTKTRLLLLKEQVLNDVIAEAKAVIVHANDMSSSFKLERVLYHLDSEKIYFQDAADVLEKNDEIEIYSGNVLPGNHVISVEMTYRGDSSVFTYLKGYVFRLRANFTFYATKGKVTSVRCEGYEKGDITWDLTKRPSIRFKVTQKGYTKETPGEEPGADKKKDEK